MCVSECVCVSVGVCVCVCVSSYECKFMSIRMPLYIAYMYVHNLKIYSFDSLFFAGFLRVRVNKNAFRNAKTA